MFTFDWRDKEKQKERITKDGVVEIYSQPSRFNGVVTVRIPKHQERIKFLKELKTSLKDNAIEESQLEMSDKVIEFAREHIQKVALKRIEDGYEFNSVEQLEYDVDGAEILADISSIIMQGVRLSKI